METKPPAEHESIKRKLLKIMELTFDIYEMFVDILSIFFYIYLVLYLLSRTSLTHLVRIA